RQKTNASSGSMGPPPVKMPTSAASATNEPILNLRIEAVIARAAPIKARSSSTEQPEFGQVLPVHEIVEHEGSKEDGHQDHGAWQLECAVAAILRHRFASLVVQREHQPCARSVQPRSGKNRRND